MNFRLLLPRIEDEDTRENIQQLCAYDESLTRQIGSLFASLKWLGEATAGQNIQGKLQLVMEMPCRLVHFESRKLSLCSHSSWRVHLLEPEALPLLKSVYSFEMYHGSIGWPSTNSANHVLQAVHVDYRMLVDIVCKFPNLEFWGCRLGGEEWRAK